MRLAILTMLVKSKKPAMWTSVSGQANEWAPAIMRATVYHDLHEPYRWEAFL